MRVLHVLKMSTYSGAENVACQIVQLCKQVGIQSAYTSADGQIREAVTQQGITFLGMEKLGVSQLKRIIKNYQPDVLHAHDVHATVASVLAGGKIPVVSHVHNNNFNTRKITVKSLLYLWAARRAKRIFWVSNSAFAGYRFNKWLRKKSQVLTNVIDMDALQQKAHSDCEDDSYDIIYIGRLTYQKNPQRLMRIFSKVCEKLPDAKIAVVGSGELEQETKALCNELHLQNNVSFLGYQSNPYPMLSCAKVMVMASRFEGMPMCALEAFTLGVPIVSTPTDGLLDLIQDGVNGFMGEDDDVLAQHLVQIVSDASLRRVLSEHATNTAKLVNCKDDYINKIVAAYQEAIAKKN